MGLEPLMLGLWAIQILAVLILVVQAALNGRWFAAAGTIVGTIIGCSPFVLMQGQGAAVWGPAIVITVLSTAALTIAYGVRLRWKALIATLLFLTIPLSYRLFAHEKFPPSTNLLFRTFALLGEVAFLLGPIACGLACREIFEGLRRLIPNAKERLTCPRK
jgi:hypothetical protein